MMVVVRALRLASIGAVALAIAAAGTPAWAHNGLVGTNPGDGSTVDSLERVQVEFADEVLELGMKIQVLDSDGADFSLGDARVEDRRFAVQDTEPLPAGKYEVKWRVVGEDGHPVSGKFTFSVAGAPEPATTPTPSATGGTDSGAEQEPPVTGEPGLASGGWTVDDEGVKVATGLGVLLVIVLGTRFALARLRR